jgi:hypothetical protein
MMVRMLRIIPHSRLVNHQDLILRKPESTGGIVRESRQLACLSRPGWNGHTHQPAPGHTMETRDHFMRIAVIASVILVGALALAVRLNS